MSKEEIDLPDIIGKTGRYQITSTLVAGYLEVILGISVCFLQYMFVDVTLYWNWDAASENKTTFHSSNCRMDGLLLLNASSNMSNEHSMLVYESRFLTNSFSEKFSTVCEWSWLISFTKGLNRLGAAAGNLMLGAICEKFGRRRTCISLLSGLLAWNLVILFSPWYWLLAVACVMVGVCTIPAYVVFVTQVTEILPATWRPLFGTLIRYGTNVGQIGFSATSWGLRNVFYIQLLNVSLIALSVPCALYVVESPVWLIVCGKDEEAKKNILVIAKRNGRNPEESERKANLWVATMKERQRQKECEQLEKISNLFKNRVITKYTICVTMIASLPIFAFMGLLLNLESFGSGLFKDMMILSAVNTFGIIVAAVALMKYSIKKLQITCFLLSAVVAVIYVFIYEYDIARTVLSALFTAILTPATCTAMVYMIEVFPTTVRIVGSGFVVTFICILTWLSPFVKDLGDKTHVFVPFILFAVLMFACAFIMIFLPETKNMKLIQTVEELKMKTRRKGDDSDHPVQTSL